MNYFFFLKKKSINLNLKKYYFFNKYSFLLKDLLVNDSELEKYKNIKTLSFYKIIKKYISFYENFI